MTDKRANAEKDVAKLFGQPFSKQQKLSFTKLSKEEHAQKQAKAAEEHRKGKEEQEALLQPSLASGNALPYLAL